MGVVVEAFVVTFRFGASRFRVSLGRAVSPRIQDSLYQSAPEAVSKP